jgi:hypothetical protein
MNKMLKPLMFVIAAGLSSLTLAEDVAVPAGQQGADQNVPRPKTGLSMDQVSSKFGEPNQKVAAVGAPPISRWIYNAYTVYFENDKVIHSVLHPAP